MIVKILSRHSPTYASLINYILKESKNMGEGPQIFTHNIRSKNVLEWEKEFVENESFRLHERANSIYAYHEIISFSSNENKAEISREMIEDISRKYIALRGNDGLIIGAVHRDTDAVHIHFMSSGLAFRTGKAFRLSRSKMLTLKSDLQKYHIQKYPSLTHSICEHGTNKPYYLQHEWQAQQRGQRNTVKPDISQTVQSCFNRASTQENFLHLLRDTGLHHYERKGKAQGIISSDGMKFRFTRLGLDIEKLKALPKDMTEEQKALNEIQALRQLRNEKSNNKQFNEIVR